MSVIARSFLISGRVQGVGFRYFVLQRAREIGLTGFTRNLEDSRVEVLAQGSPVDLDRLEAALRQGPALSRVDEVRIAGAPLQSTAKEFQILR